MPVIFQYGSNCDSDRLNSPARLSGGAKDLGCAETIGEYEMAFNKWSQGNGCAAADLMPASAAGRHAWGVLYNVSEEGLKKLAEIEGRSYEPKIFRVRNEAGEEVDATTFVVKERARKLGLSTTAKYVGHIVNGLRKHGVPEYYVQRVIDDAVRTNTNAEDSVRAVREEAFLTRLRTP